MRVETTGAEQLWIGLAIGLIVGLVFMAVVWRVAANRKADQRKQRNQFELEGNRITNTSQVMYFAVQSSPDAIAVVDNRRSVILSNSRAHELGLVRERMIDDNVWSVVERVLADREPRELYVTPATTRRGSRPLLAVAGHVQLLSLSDERYAVVYAKDVSEQVRMESARRDFVANVSHELKTPVGAISLLVETMMGSKDDPEAVDYFGGKLTKEVTRMKTMISELISLSKLQGAESLPDPVVVSVDRIIEEALDRCRTSAEAANIELLKDEDSSLRILGDKSLLVTAVANLVTNAINYSPSGSPVSISRGLSGDMVQISVTDRGIGISPEDQKRLYERFFRVDKARSRNTGGTGLGLAIVKHVMHNHGGSVSVWSRVGTGSTFTIELPNHDAASGKQFGHVVEDLSLDE